MRKTFLYLTQTEANAPKAYRTLTTARSDLLCLGFHAPGDADLYAPGATWTEGRNLLWRAARALPQRYAYYIFIDDDVDFSRGDWRAFEELLLRYRPHIAFPHCWNIHPPSELEAHNCYSFDAMVNAFSAATFFDSPLLPYFDGLDDVSWSYSQLPIIHLASILTPERSMMFRGIEAANMQRRPYPRGDRDDPVVGFAGAQAWLKARIFTDHPLIVERFQFHPQVVQTETYRPATPAPNARRFDYEPALLNHNSDYWARIGEIRRGIVRRAHSALRFDLKD